jgi:hypothetical protein
MKWIALAGEVAGCLSSVLLAWGYTPPTGAILWSNSNPGFERSRYWRSIAARVGFAALAASFAAQAWATLNSD